MSTLFPTRSSTPPTASLPAAGGGTGSPKPRRTSGSANVPPPPPPPPKLPKPVSFFTENAGQWPKEVRFAGDGHRIEVTSSGYRLPIPGKRGTIDRREPRNARMASLQDLKAAAPMRWLELQFVGLPRGAKPTGAGSEQVRIHYFLGADPRGWFTEVPAWKEVVFSSPGGESLLVIRQTQQGLDLCTGERAADLRRLRFRLTGASSVRFANTDGRTVPARFASHLRVSVGRKYRILPLLRRPPEIAAPPTIVRLGQSGFEVRNPFRGVDATDGEGPDQDRTLAAPVRSQYDTETLGSFFLDVVCDADDNMYTCGSVYRPISGMDVCVTKYAPGGLTVYRATIGGSGADYGSGLTLDDNRCVYVTGETDSPDLPITSDAFDSRFGGRASSAFLAKLDPHGRPVYCTYLGGKNGRTIARAAALNSRGEVCLVGATTDRWFPVTANAHQPRLAGFRNAFVAVLRPGSRDLVYSTYLGGSVDDYGMGITVRGSQLCVCGQAGSPDFPTTPNAYQRRFTATRRWGTGVSRGLYDGPAHAFVTILKPGLRRLLYSTFLGGQGPDEAWDLISEGPKLYVCGLGGADFPHVHGFRRFAGDATRGSLGPIDAFVAKIDPTLSGDESLIYATLFGGGSEDCAYAITRGTHPGEVCVTGYTCSTDFPVMPGAFQPTMAGTSSAFVATVDTLASGDSSYTSGSFFGGGTPASSTIPVAAQFGSGIARGSHGTVAVVGDTTATDLPYHLNDHPGFHAVGYLLVAELRES